MLVPRPRSKTTDCDRSWRKSRPVWQTSSESIMGGSHHLAYRTLRFFMLAKTGSDRASARLCGAFRCVFLHHDGGIEERGGLLQGLISRADCVFFPVDCISHAAMSLVKRTCRQSGKPFLPLRGAGLAPFCAALNNRAALVGPSLPQETA